MVSLRHWVPGRKFFAQLARCDEQVAEQVGSEVRCLRCGGRLHRADYPRKPLGWERVTGLIRRVSFCCAERECRRRLTPPSFRFADRKWYALLIVVLAAALGPSGPEHVTGQVEVGGASPSLRSVRRWQGFFRGEFAESKAWLWLRGRLGCPPDASQLPQGLLAWTKAQGHQRAEVVVGETINLLAWAGLGSRIAQFDGAITIRREWCC